MMSDPAHTTTGANANSFAPMWDIRDILAIFWKRLGWLVLPAVLLAGVAIAYMLLVPARYDAKATLLIDPRGLQVVDRTLEPNRNSGEESLALVESQVRVLTSDGLLRKLIDRENLVADDEFGRPPAGIVAMFKEQIADLIGSTIKITDPKLATLDRLRKAVRAERAPGSYIVDIFVRSEDPAKAARLANTIAALFIDEDRRIRSTSSGRVGNELSTQLDGLKQQVTAAERKVEAFKTEQGLVSARGNLINEQKLAEVANQIVQARLKTQEAQARVDQIADALKSGGSSEAIGDPVASPTISALRVRLAAARQIEAQLLATLRPAHPSVQAATASIRSISAQIRSELSRIAETARAELARAKNTEAQVTASEDRLRREVERTSGAAVALRELERERDSVRKVYESYLVRVRELGGQSSVDTSNSRIYSTATPPQNKSSPGLMVLLAGSIAAGLVIGAVLALLTEQLAAPRTPTLATPAPQALQSRRPVAPRAVQAAPTTYRSSMPQPPMRQTPRGSAPIDGYTTRPVTMPPVPPSAAPPRSVRSAMAPAARTTTVAQDAMVATFDRSHVDNHRPLHSERAVASAAESAVVTLRPQPAAAPTRTPVRFRPSAAFRPVTLVGTLTTDGYPADQVRDIVFADPTSEQADAFFSAAYLLANADRNHAARVVVVTSDQGCKASALGAFNLALASAASGERVLLIDGDISPRRLSRTLVPAAVRGLSDVIDGHLTIADVTWSDPETFDLVPAAGLLRRHVDGERLAHTIAVTAGEARGYSRIIIDAGALDDVVGSAPRITRLADAVLLMVSVADASAPATIVRPAALEPVGEALIGAIGVAEY